MEVGSDDACGAQCDELVGSRRCANQCARPLRWTGGKRLLGDHVGACDCGRTHSPAQRVPDLSALGWKQGTLFRQLNRASGRGPVLVAWDMPPPLGTIRAALPPGSSQVLEVVEVIGETAIWNRSTRRRQRFLTVLAKPWDGLYGTPLWPAGATPPDSVSLNVWAESSPNGRSSPHGGIWFATK